MNIEISCPIGYCRENIEKIDIYFNNISYTTILNFNTKSTNINITSIFDADSYQYYIQRYKILDDDIDECFNILGVVVCRSKCIKYGNIITDKIVNYYQKQYEVKSFIILS